MFFLALVVGPIVRRQGSGGLFVQLVREAGVRFRLIGWTCLLMLLLTGIFQLVYRGYGWADLWSGPLWQSQFGKVLALKLVAVGIIFLLSALHDFSIGPRATVLMQENPESREAKSMRRLASWIGRINMLLALFVLFLALMLIRGLP